MANRAQRRKSNAHCSSPKLSEKVEIAYIGKVNDIEKINQKKILVSDHTCSWPRGIGNPPCTIIGSPHLGVSVCGLKILTVPITLQLLF